MKWNLLSKTLLINFAIFSSHCQNKIESDKIIALHQSDTLTFEVFTFDTIPNSARWKTVDFLFSYNHNLFPVPTSYNHFPDGVIYKNFTFDQSKSTRRDNADCDPYSFPYYSKYYFDTTRRDMAILVQCLGDLYIPTKETYQDEFRFEKVLKKVFPNLKFLSNNFQAYHDSLVDHVEFIVPYLENNQLYFTYNNFKLTTYLHEKFTFKILFVKKGLQTGQILEFANNYESNHKISRLKPLIPAGRR